MHRQILASTQASALFSSTEINTLMFICLMWPMTPFLKENFRIMDKNYIWVLIFARPYTTNILPPSFLMMQLTHSVHRAPACRYKILVQFASLLEMFYYRLQGGVQGGPGQLSICKVQFGVATSASSHTKMTPRGDICALQQLHLSQPSGDRTACQCLPKVSSILLLN